MMKVQIKKILVLSCLGILCVSSGAHAQKGVQIGLRFIPQSTSLRYDTGFPLIDILKLAPYDQRWRTAQGIGVLYHPHERWSVGADMLYSLQGGGYKARRTNVNYLSVPVLFGYNASPRHRLIFNIQTGLDVAFLVRARMRYSDGTTLDISRYVNQTAWGIPFAIGFKYRVHRTYFLNTQLYVYSDLTSLTKTNDTYGVRNYILPGIRFTIDRNVGK